jgi:hypothetical protein
LNNPSREKLQIIFDLSNSDFAKQSPGMIPLTDRTQPNPVPPAQANCQFAKPFISANLLS